MIGQTSPKPTPPGDAEAPEPTATPPAPVGVDGESGGREGPDPTRYGDWEKNGRCIDF